MKRALFIFCAVLAVACGGHGNGMLPSANPGAGTTRTVLPIISAAFVKNARRISAPNVRLHLLPRFLTRGRQFARVSGVGSGDQEIEGIAIQPTMGSPYTGMLSVQTAYVNQFIQIGYPPGDSGITSLIAPLMIPPNKACLGTGEVYSNGGVGTEASFLVIDFCSGTIPFATPVNTAFLQTYARVMGRNAPEITSLVFTLDANPGPSSMWYALLYNYVTGQFDIAASSTGISASTTGLSVWLGQFLPGPCPVTPVMAADSMYLYNGSTKSFEIMQPTMVQTTTSAFNSGATCFSGNQGGPASFAFSIDNPNSAWSVVSTPQPPAITEFSNGLTGGGLSQITAGADGNLWFLEYVDNKIGRITTTGVITEFSKGIARNSQPMGITSGPDGNIWFTLNGPAPNNTQYVDRITPSGQVTQFSKGITPGGAVQGITTGPDGNLWFTEAYANKIGRITPSGAVTEFSNGISPLSNLFGITSGPDGNVWAVGEAGRVERITPSGAVTEFTNGITPDSCPYGIITGIDLNLWFTQSCAFAPQIGRITPSGAVTEFSSGLVSGASVYALTNGPDGNLWFADANYGIGRITPAGVSTEFPIGMLLDPVYIAMGADGNLWFTQPGYNVSTERIGRATP